MSGESYYKSIDSRQSPSKELPTKLLKQDRIKERQELSQTLHYDRDHLLKLKNRCVAASQPGYVSKSKNDLINKSLVFFKDSKGFLYAKLYMVEVYYISCLSFKFGEHITVSKKKLITWLNMANNILHIIKTIKVI